MGQKQSAQSGNVLLIVLIGIALFAALMFFISRAKSSDMGTAENAAMYAQQITSYAEKLHGAVQSVMLQNNCLATQVSFENPTAGGYANGANALCKVFDVNGGGMVYQAPPAQAIDTSSGSPLAGNYYFEGNACVTGAGTGPATANGAACSAANSEIIFVMPFVTQAVCAQIDQITMNTTTIPTVSADAFDGATKFTGTFAGTYTITTGSTTYPAGCFQSSGSAPGAGYHFYEVLVAR
jgi:hypothetical protein